MFAFPSGIAELAERHGLVLAEAMTTTPDKHRPGGPQALASGSSPNPGDRVDARRLRDPG